MRRDRFLEQYPHHLKAMRKVAQKTLDYDDADDAVSACIRKILSNKTYHKIEAAKLRGFLCSSVYFKRLEIARANRQRKLVMTRLPDEDVEDGNVIVETVYENQYLEP